MRKTDARLPIDVSVVAKGEGHDRLLREISLALAGRRGATILVAEDDADLRGVLTASLTRNGHRVIQARDGAEALAAIEREQVDLLVLDLVMPNIDGFEVLARLKEHPEGRHDPGDRRHRHRSIDDRTASAAPRGQRLPDEADRGRSAHRRSDAAADRSLIVS